MCKTVLSVIQINALEIPCRLLLQADMLWRDLEVAQLGRPCLTNVCRKRLVAKNDIFDALRLTNVSRHDRIVATMFN